MKSAPPAFALKLLGAFRLTGVDGERIEPSTKGMALIAMLAMADDGERPRRWLRDRLWGSRGEEQAQGSLRQELRALNRQLNGCGVKLLDYQRDVRNVRLALEHIQVDARDLAHETGGRPGFARREFLEGFDIPGEEGFEDWLRQQRDALETPADAPGSLPRHVVDLNLPMPGFAGQPALAVLPFVNLTGDPGADYLAQGLSEDLIDLLARLRWLPVIARSSSFAAGAEPVDHQAVGAQLGAKYLFEGRLRGAEGSYSLGVELTEAASRRVLWSRRLGLPSLSAPDMQTQLVTGLVGALDTRIDTAEQAAPHARMPHDLTVHDLIWRGRWHINRLTREDALRAAELFDQALALAPQSAEALIQAAWALGRSIWAERRDEAQVRRMRGLAQQAIQADPEDGRGHWLAGVAEMWLRNPDRAKALLRRAITLNPSLAEAHSALGDTYAWNGEAELALQSLRTALQLSPTDLMVFTMLSTMATAYWMQQSWAEAVDLAEQSIIRRPGYWYGHVIKITALVDLGDAAGAQRAWRDLKAAKRRFDLDAVDWVPFVEPSWNARIKERLAQARRGADG